MDDYHIWKPIADTEPGKYLYHYTTYSTALKIIYYDTLRFSRLSGTNDAFEQKPKLKCATDNPEFRELFISAHELFQTYQNRILLLCFSMDPKLETIQQQYDMMQKHLSKDQQHINVNGRGFALPRMWAQYAENNTGVCFVFEKKRLDDAVKTSNLVVSSHEVEYSDYYIPIELGFDDEESLKRLLENASDDSISSFIQEKSKYVEYNYFSKLKDWESENEYRYITYKKAKRNQSPALFVDIRSIHRCLCGVVVGHEIDAVGEKTIGLMLAYQGWGIPLKRLIYEDMYTHLKPIKY